MLNGPPDLDAVVAHAARIVWVPAEQRQVVLDEPAVHEANRWPVRQLITASLENLRNGMQATNSVSTTEEAAAALGVTVSYLHHDGDGLYVEMLAATGGDSYCHGARGRSRSPRHQRRYGITFRLCPPRTLWR